MERFRVTHRNEDFGVGIAVSEHIIPITLIEEREQNGEIVRVPVTQTVVQIGVIWEEKEEAPAIAYHNPIELRYEGFLDDFTEGDSDDEESSEEDSE